MRPGGTYSPCEALRQDQQPAGPVCLKRKLRHYQSPTRYRDCSYPSPPMSNPPSPSRSPPAHDPSSPSREQPARVQPSTSSTTTSMPGVALAAPSLGPPFYESTSHSRSESYPPAPSYGSYLPLQAAPTHQGEAISTSAQSGPGPTSAIASRPTSSRGGRKSKAHVASACVNCKRAHLSCDVNRPCGRCVASGKQDTCFDVQHKKRGRPRLREEGGFKVEQMLPEPGPSTTVGYGLTASPGRPMAAPRHRRTESYRSLRSQGSDSSGMLPSPTYPYPSPSSAGQPTFGLQQPPRTPSSVPSAYELPTAYLDLDLVFIKANPSFRQIMLPGRDLVGRQLSEVAAPADGETFVNIRSRLRAERETRDPAYMPPINQPGQDPLLGASEADVEQYTRGFDDRTYTWTQTQISSSAQAFPARVRLGKSHGYFVAVTLPSFRPVEQIAPQAPPSLSRMGTSSSATHAQGPHAFHSSARHIATHSAPPTIKGYVPFPGGQSLTTASRPSSQQSMGRTYPSSQPLYSTQHQHQHQHQQPYSSYPQSGHSGAGTPRLAVAEPPTDTTAFTLRSAPRELPQPSGAATGPQLPPIISGSPAPAQASAPPMPTSTASTAAIAGPSTSRPPAEQTSSVTATSGESEETPRKRRRLDLDDVLHR